MPASFRSYLSKLGIMEQFVTHHLIINLLRHTQDRIEKMSNTIDSLNPFEEKRDFFATSILSESINLQFDTEGRITLTTKLLKHSKIKKSILFVGQGKTFQIWEPKTFEKFKVNAKKKSNLNRASLKWEHQLNK